MPLSLRELQVAFASHLIAGDRPDLIASLVGGPGSPESRLRIHRHHVFHSLTTALATTFSTVHALVGEEFFRGLAHAFVIENPPSRPVLAEYGERFDEFISTFQPANVLPYLADVARLDWALNVAFCSPMEPRLTLDDFGATAIEQLPGMTLALANGVSVIHSRYPIDRIWAAAQPGASDATVDAGSGGATLLIVRRPERAGFVSLAAGEAGFLEGVAALNTLEEAANRAHEVDATFDLSSAFARFLALQVFAVPHDPSH